MAIRQVYLMMILTLIEGLSWVSKMMCAQKELELELAVRFDGRFMRSHNLGVYNVFEVML